MLIITVSVNADAPLFRFGVLNTQVARRVDKKVRYDIYRLFPGRKELLCAVWHQPEDRAMVLTQKAIAKIQELHPELQSDGLITKLNEAKKDDY